MNPLADQMMDLCLNLEKGQTLKADLAYCRTALELWKVELVVREEKSNLGPPQDRSGSPPPWGSSSCTTLFLPLYLIFPPSTSNIIRKSWRVSTGDVSRCCAECNAESLESSDNSLPVVAFHFQASKSRCSCFAEHTAVRILFIVLPASLDL